MKTRTVVLALVAMFLAGAAAHYALAAADTMNDPATITKGMWANMVMLVANQDLRTTYAYDPASNTITANVPYRERPDSASELKTKADSQVARIRLLLEPLFPGAKTDVRVASKKR